MISVVNLGRCDYAAALALQRTLVELRQQGRVPNVLLFVEHPPVITLGRNAKAGNIVASREMLAARGIEVHESDRGGDVTFHGPGQLVGYPIFDLRSFAVNREAPRLGVIAYVRLLEEVLMRVCAQYRVETQRIRGLTGLWTLAAPPPRLGERALDRDYIPDPCVPCPDSPHLPPAGKYGPPSAAHPERKIAAIGVHIARGVTSHGFALNVTTALEYFQLIVPCGLTRPVTSIEFETGLQPSLEEVMTHASRAFGELFGSQMLWLESLDDLLAGEAAPAPPTQPPPEPNDTPARAPENERRIAGDDIHLA